MSDSEEEEEDDEERLREELEVNIEPKIILVVWASQIHNGPLWLYGTVSFPIAQAHYFMDLQTFNRIVIFQDLIDDNPIEEDSDGENSDGSRRQKRKSRSDDELDDRLEDDDYDLLEENLGVKVHRRVRIMDSV